MSCIVTKQHKSKNGDLLVEIQVAYVYIYIYIQISLNIIGILNLYITLFFCKTPIEGEELFLMTRFEVLNKFKTSNLVIRNNFSPSIGVLQKNQRYI